MNLINSTLQSPHPPRTDPIKEQLGRVAEELLASLPVIEQLSPEQRRGIIARYSSVLEGNFIYWMTGAYLAARSEETRLTIEGNLLEEVRDCHPGMLRKFVIAARAVPNDSDALEIYPELSAVRLFIGRLSPAPMLAMMAFFEDFIQKFMAYLAELARRQGSEEQEYTRVHGICDITHSQELFHALEMEIAFASGCGEPVGNLFEGVYLLRALIQAIIAGPVCSAPLLDQGLPPNVN
jgi:hypothetical protein